MIAALQPTPRGESIRRLETLVSPYTGVIRRVEEVLAAANEIPLVAVSCETADGQLLPGAPVRRVGSGSGPSQESALAAALGEAVERYSAACPPEPEQLVTGRAAEIGRDAVRPERFALFHREQHDDDGFPYRPFTAASPITWVRGFALPGGEPALIPAQLVYLSDSYGRDEVLIGPSTSSGLACHATLEEAALTGLFELVERDAFMIVWANRLALPRLTWERDGGLLAFEDRYLVPTGLRYSAVDLSCFWRIPTVLGVVRGSAPATAALGVGASSAATIQEAVRKALDEACRVQAWATELMSSVHAREFAPDCSDVCDFDDHVHYYADRERARAADFLDASSDLRDVGEVEPLCAEPVRPLIEAVTDRLHAHGSSAFVVDVTAPDIQAAGLAVARVVAPELCPLDADHRTRFLGGRRLYEAPLELGFSGLARGPADLNPYPHPFP